MEIVCIFLLNGTTLCIDDLIGQAGTTADTNVADVAARRWVPLRRAWQTALYGPRGFYRRESPDRHFRTSPQASARFAAAVAGLADRLGLTRVVDLGAGSGQLLADLAAGTPALELVGVELRPRPAGLPATIEWCSEVRPDAGGLLVANEVLDNVACDVVELDARGRCRLVEVDVTTGDQRLGEPAEEEVVDWTTRWWPLLEPGRRAEVGIAREVYWAGICGRLGLGACVAVDYGHLSGARPPEGTLASYRRGRQTPVRFDGRCDVTAHVAFDSLAAVVGGTPRRQRTVLAELGLRGRRPDIARAPTDPRGYLQDLARAGEEAELTAIGGFGDFYWLVSSRP